MQVYLKLNLTAKAEETLQKLKAKDSDAAISQMSEAWTALHSVSFLWPDYFKFDANVV